MAPGRKISLPKDSAEEIAQLEKIIEGNILYKKQLNEKIEEVTAEKTELFKQVCELKKSLEVAYARIQALEVTPFKPSEGEALREGYVEVATIPLIHPMTRLAVYPHPTRIDGMTILSRKDEDGIMFETLPVKNAVAIMNQKNFKRYLIGPADKISGVVPIIVKGQMYQEEVTFCRHKKSTNGMGEIIFTEVQVEESPTRTE